MEGIDRKALDDIFPFSFKVGVDMTLLKVSLKLAAMAPKMIVGSKILDCLQFERPILKKYSFDALLNYQKATVEIKIDGIQGVNFVGQIVQNQSSQQEIIFLVKPFANNLSDLAGAGFTLSDFAPSDALPDLLLGIQFAETKSVQLKEQNELLSEEININRFLSDIFACDTLETLFLKIAESVSRTLEADDVIIYKVESDLARQAAGAGSSRTIAQVSELGFAIPSGVGIVGKAVSEKKTQLVMDVTKDDDYIEDAASLGGSEISVPIIIDGQVIAVIDSESEVINRYSEEDVHLLEIFAGLAGQAIISQKRQVRAQQETLQTAQRLKSKNQNLRSISHEFRTPLAQISSGVQLLSRHGGAMDESEKSDTLESLLHPIDRLTNLFDSLMNENEGVKEKIVIEEFCLIKLINRIAKEALRPYGRNSDLLVSSQMQEVKLHSSREYLTQIIINLLVNAAKYSTINTEIKIAVEVLRGRISISVSDLGIGIKESHLGAIFEPHMRSDEAMSMAEGSGFGLSIVRDKVGELGGEISVTSTEGIGSCFQVSLPETA
ncbi:MAG: GAF domain-containing protein [Planctomycetes bacterium]|nr:GAF domain-containing protein [Planctomycetota bacterium]